MSYEHLGQALGTDFFTVREQFTNEHAELIDFLTQTMIRLGFDERAFMAVLLNTPPTSHANSLSGCSML